METLMNGNQVMMDGISSMHMGWQLWIGWMILLNTGALLFAFTKMEARVIFGAFFLNGIFMCWLAGTYGYVRLLGLSHVVFWTPLMIYLILRIRKEDFERASLFGRYVLVVVVTDTASLIIDYIDVIRYVAGDRGTA